MLHLDNKLIGLTTDVDVESAVDQLGIVLRLRSSSCAACSPASSSHTGALSYGLVTVELAVKCRHGVETSDSGG